MTLLVQHGADVTRTITINNVVAMSISLLPINPGRLDIVSYLLERSTSINQLELSADGKKTYIH